MDIIMDIATRIKQAKDFLRTDRGKDVMCAVYLGYKEWMELTKNSEYLEYNHGRISSGVTRFACMPIYRVVKVSHFNVSEIKPMI